MLNRFQLLARLFHVLEGFHDGFSHFFVGFLRPTDDGELIGAGYTLVAVLVVEADSEQV